MKRCIALFASFLLASTFILAQGSSVGGVQGKVTADDGTVLKDATITIQDLKLASNVYTTKTDEKGQYLYNGLYFSEYKVTAHLEGYRDEVKTFKIKLGEKEKMDFTMIPMEKALREAEAKNVSSGPSLTEEAKNLFEQENYEGALAKALESITKNENLEASYLIKGMSCEKLNKKDDSISAYEQVITINQNNKDVYGVLSNLYLEKGEKDKAKLCLDKYKALGGVVSNESFNKGATLYNEGKMQEALPFFEQSIKENPNDPDPYRLLAYCYLNKGDVKKCVEHLKEYTRLAPTGKYIDEVKATIKAFQK